jgi:hypothetical protein
MAKRKLTLTVDDALIEKIKIQAVKDRRSLSDITEELYREYLKRVGRQRPNRALVAPRKGEKNGKKR